jgi:aryl-alcohol dehydrogenase-like predicted oxidoreductase
MKKSNANNMQRRDFLSLGATLGLASLMPSVLLGSQSSDAPLKSKEIASAGHRKLGKLKVSPIGLGCQWYPGGNDNTISDIYTNKFDKKAGIKIIRSAVEEGITLIDTAELYGPFIAESVVGEALQGIRNKAVIATKFGANIDPETGAFGNGMFNSEPKHVRRAIEGSLKRLKTDRIDLVYQHRVDPNVPIEDVAGVIKDMMKEGKILHWGLSEPGIKTLRRAHAENPLSAIQNEYSMLWRGPETEILSVCEELGIGFVCWCPLGMGFLSEKINSNSTFVSTESTFDYRAGVPRFSPDNLKHNIGLYNIILKWAEHKEVFPAQFALAWLLAQKPFIVPIPGTTRITHMKQNMDAASIKFSTDELKEIRAEIEAFKIAGARSPEADEHSTGVESALKK